MNSGSTRVSDPFVETPGGDTQLSPVDVWHQTAEKDYRLCRDFADRFDARLERSLRSRRVGWQRGEHRVYGILLPDPLPSASHQDDEWYIYYVWGETLFRRTHPEREQRKMIVLAESVEDWAELLRQAVRDQIFDVRYEVTPHYITAFGEIENAAAGYEFSVYMHGPQMVSRSACLIAGTGSTPEAAAREACRRWLEAQHSYR